MGGFTSTTLTTDEQNVIISATATTLNVSTSSVTYLGATQVSRRKLRAVQQTALVQSQPHTASITIVASLSVSVLLDSYPSAANATALFNNLQSTLVSAVTSGAFTATVQATAALQGVTALQTVTADSATVTLSEVTTPSDSSSNDDSLSDGEVAGVVIGSIVGAALIAGIAYFLIYGRAGYNKIQGA